MVNQANVKALRALVARFQTERWMTKQATQAHGKDAYGMQLRAQAEQGPLDGLADFLAAYGVLAPSALTDEQAYEIGSGWEELLPASLAQKAAAQVRAELERVAKGDV